MHAERFAPMLVVSLLLGAGCAEQGGGGGEEPDADRAYSFTTLEYPGATVTVAYDVADDGRVVGWYSAGDVPRGFIYADGRYTSVEHPGAVLTHVTGIASDGSLVGAYRKAGEPTVAWYGFVRRPSGEFEDVRHPDHPHSMAQRILENGAILGCYHAGDYTTSMRGMVVSRGGITVHESPGSMTNGGTPDGSRLVGMLAGEGRGFIAEGDRVTHLEAPGSTRTEAWDINGAGAIVGVMVDSASASRGFVLERGRWTPIEAPEARSTVAFGINARGDIVGAFEDAEGRRRGYIATRQ